MKESKTNLEEKKEDVLRPEDYQELLTRFPEVRFAFAYGSGVIKQGDYAKRLYESNVDANEKINKTPSVPKSDKDIPLFDVIFAVDNSQQWHIDNKRMNPDHYTSFLSAWSIPTSFETNANGLFQQIAIYQANFIAHIQEEYGSRMWFNSFVPMEISACPHRQMKYGVISTRDFVNDLQNWESLYIAGRLHKPVRIFANQENNTDAQDTNNQLQYTDNDDTSVVSTLSISQLITENLRFAVSVALLILTHSSSADLNISPHNANTFTETDVYITIAGLSYLGDPRMSLMENPHKVNNLVMPIISQYQSLYRQILLDLADISGIPTFEASVENYTFSTLAPEKCRHYLAQVLPDNLKLKLADFHLNDVPSSEDMKRAIYAIVSKSATSQTLKGILTVGVVKSASYCWQKIKKRIWGGKM
jgi:translocator assembly and maintenance protein 41